MNTRNRATLEHLLDTGGLELCRSDRLAAEPPPLPPETAWDRVAGMLLGLAIGDSLGNTTEGLSPARRAAGFGTIRDYLPNRFAGGAPAGTPSDDTQLAFWTLEQLNEDGGLVPEHLADRFCREPIFGIGRTVSRFRLNRERGLPWHQAGPRADAAGNGALMRIAPVLLPYLRHPGPGLWADTALAAMLTHNDPASTGSCLALVRILWEALRSARPPDPRWWLETFCDTLRPLEGETRYRSRAPHLDYEGPVWRFAAEQVEAALTPGRTVRAACDHWYSGAYLLETVPSVLYILCRWGHDPEEALVRAVNDTWDNDTCAAIVGAAVGALHGAEALPARWRQGLLGRTAAADEGRVFTLMEAARERWWRRPGGE